MYLSLRDLKYTKARYSLVCTVIALIALMTTVLAGLATGLVNDGISGLRNLPMTLKIVLVVQHLLIKILNHGKALNQ